MIASLDGDADLYDGEEGLDAIDYSETVEGVAVDLSAGTAVGVIPDGTGMLILSNDTTLFHHNIVQGNGTFGIALIDQAIVNALSPGTFDPPSPEQSSSGNTFRANLVTGNGNAPDTQGSNGVPAEIASNIFYAVAEPAPNCFEGNVVGDGPDPIGLDLSVCPPIP